MNSKSSPTRQTLSPSDNSHTNDKIWIMQASVAFMAVVREVLLECGITEASSFASMSSDLVARARFIIVEVNESREAYLEADRINHFSIVSKTLDRLYDTAEDITLTPEYRAVVVSKLVKFKKSISKEHRDRYDTGRMSKRMSVNQD